MLAGVGRESYMEEKVSFPLYFPVSELAALVGCRFGFVLFLFHLESV